jgi:hypothetical protein
VGELFSRASAAHFFFGLHDVGAGVGIGVGSGVGAGRDPGPYMYGPANSSARSLPSPTVSVRVAAAPTIPMLSRKLSPCAFQTAPEFVTS